MKRRHAISLGLGIFSICSMLYSLPKTVEAVQNAKAGGALEPEEGVAGGLAEMLNRVGRGAPTVEALQRGLGAAGEGAEEVSVFTPEGDGLSAEDRAELVRQAARMNALLDAPDPRDGGKKKPKAKIKPKITVER